MQRSGAVLGKNEPYPFRPFCITIFGQYTILVPNVKSHHFKSIVKIILPVLDSEIGRLR